MVLFHKDKLRKKTFIFSLIITTLVSIIVSLSVEAVTITRGPFLQLSTEDSIVLRWRTLENLESRVRYKEAGNNVEEIAINTSSLLIHGELSPNSADFVGGKASANISSRPKTNELFEWKPPQWTSKGAQGIEQRTIDGNGNDISKIIEEIIMQDDWNSGNSMAFIIFGSGERVAHSFDGKKGVNQSPRLHVEYTLNGNPQVNIDIALAGRGCDAEEYVINRDVNISSSDLELGGEAAISTRSQLVGIKFNNVSLPKWSPDIEIVKAYIQFTVDEVNSDFNKHEVTITGLKPGTKYFYEILDESNNPIVGGEPDYFFETNPPIGTVKPTRIWVLGDSGQAGLETDANKNRLVRPGAGKNARKVRDAFYNWNGGSKHVDMVLMLGDNAYTVGIDEEYQFGLFNVYGDTIKNSVLWATVGNHEFCSTSTTFTDSILQSGTFFDTFTFARAGESGGIPSGSEVYFSFDYANIHIISLESLEDDTGFQTTMKNWLLSDLAACKQKWIIALWHHPPYSNGTHDTDAAIEKESRYMREEILPILEANGVDLVLVGHSHSYERAMLIHGHYDVSDTFDKSKMGIDTSNGNDQENGAYVKVDPVGTVYTLAGSASKVGRFSGSRFGNNPDINFHPAMVESLWKLGSLVLDLDATGKKIDAYFIDDDGNELDHFVLKKPNVVFTAYNDLSCGESCTCSTGKAGSLSEEKITYYTTEQGPGTPPCGDSGNLVDFNSGTITDVMLKVSGGLWNGKNHTRQGNLSNDGTDAYRVFNGKLDAKGLISYGDDTVLEFSGMNPNHRYEMVIFGNRDNENYTNRISKVTIEGAASFKNKSTFGTDVEITSADTIIINGTNKENGYVARFTDIDPEADGFVKIIISDGGSQSAPRNYVNALMLRAVDL